MRLEHRVLVWLGLVSCGALGGATSPVGAKPASKRSAQSFRLGNGRIVEPGVVWNEVRLPSRTGVMRLWIYRPA